MLQPNRLQLTCELLQCYGAFEDSLLMAPRVTAEEELLSFRTRDYVEAVAEVKRFVFPLHRSKHPLR